MATPEEIEAAAQQAASSLEQLRIENPAAVALVTTWWGAQRGSVGHRRLGRLLLGMSPFRCPSLFTILSFMEYEYGVYHPRGGTGAVMAAMAKVARELGARVNLGQQVEERLLTLEGDPEGIDVLAQVLDRSLEFRMLQRGDCDTARRKAADLVGQIVLGSVGIKAGESYVDVGTLHGYRTAMTLLMNRQEARTSTPVLRRHHDPKVAALATGVEP